jgi:hypothetical protein
MTVHREASRTAVFEIGVAVIKPPDAEMEEVTKRPNVSPSSTNISFTQVGLLD